MMNSTTYWICLIINFCFITGIYSQKDSIEIVDKKDSVSFLQKSWLYAQEEVPDYPFKALDWVTSDKGRNPTVALIAGIIPGGGQLYNRQFEKLMAYYAGVGGLMIVLDNNYTQYQLLKTAYEQRIAGEPDIYADILNTPQRLKAVRDQFRKNLELTYFGAFAFYMVGVIDGFVSAHLSTFDISDDISLRPNLLLTPNLSPTAGIAFTWTF